MPHLYGRRSCVCVHGLPPRIVRVVFKKNNEQLQRVPLLPHEVESGTTYTPNNAAAIRAHFLQYICSSML